MKKTILILAVLFLPHLALAQYQPSQQYIVVTPNPGDNSSSYVSNTGETGQIRHYPGGVTVITPYPRDEVCTQTLLDNFSHSVQSLPGDDGAVNNLIRKHVPGFLED